VANAAVVTEAQFDRGGFRLQGRIRARAEAAREAGLKISVQRAGDGPLDDPGA